MDFDVYCMISGSEPRFVQFGGVGNSNPGPVCANSAWRTDFFDFDIYCIISGSEPRFVQFWGARSSNPGPVCANSAWGTDFLFFVFLLVGGMGRRPWNARVAMPQVRCSRRFQPQMEFPTPTCRT